jgi:hypothetical protein
MPKLTDKDELGGESALTDQLHIVRAGVSYRRSLDNFLKTGKIPYRTVQTGDREMIVFRADPEANQTNVLEAGDFVIWFDLGSGVERMIIGVCIDDVSSYPTDLENSAKFIRFLDVTSML